MRGILNINKPAAISSYDCIRQLKPVFNPKKIGHAGTLDPIATGVLLILLNEATKISRLLMSLPKEYEAKIRFGIATDTDDITGRPLETTPVPNITATDMERVLSERFSGELAQVPPRYSALKMSGQPLYKLARKGVGFTPQARKITIYELKLLGWHPPIAHIYARVSGGTYIRALCRDIGRALSSAATLSHLTRIRVGNFTIEQAYPLSQLLKNQVNPAELLVPIEQALDHMPRMIVSSEQAQQLLQGKAIIVHSSLVISHLRNNCQISNSPTAEYILAQTDNQRFLALARMKSNWLFPERIIYADRKK